MPGQTDGPAGWGRGEGAERGEDGARGLACAWPEPQEANRGPSGALGCTESQIQGSEGTATREQVSAVTASEARRRAAAGPELKQTPGGTVLQNWGKSAFQMNQSWGRLSSTGLARAVLRERRE